MAFLPGKSSCVQLESSVSAIKHRFCDRNQGGSGTCRTQRLFSLITADILGPSVAAELSDDRCRDGRNASVSSTDAGDVMHV